MAAAGNYMDSDAWAVWVVALIVGAGALFSGLAWAAGRRGGGRRG